MKESKYLKASDENIEKLLSIPMLKDFETADLERILTRSKIKQYDPGECIIKEGEQSTGLFFLLAGSIRISKDGQELTVLKRRGDVFGEMALISNRYHSASAHAIEETVCLVTDSQPIEGASGKDRIAFYYLLYWSFAHVLAERMKTTNEELVKAREEIEALKKRLGERS